MRFCAHWRTRSQNERLLDLVCGARGKSTGKKFSGRCCQRPDPKEKDFRSELRSRFRKFELHILPNLLVRSFANV